MISLSLLKKHLNIDEDFHDDDIILMQIIETSEEAVIKDLDLADASKMYDEYGEYRPAVLHAILMFAGSLYNNRESTNTLTVNIVPHGYQYLVLLNKKYL